MIPVKELQPHYPTYMTKQKKIAILCNYELQPERIGGMDYFFWLFDQQCKEKSIQVDWFFPNNSQHGEYPSLTIIESGSQNVETFFLQYGQENKTVYTHIVTHFIELCTPFFYKLRKVSDAKIIAVDHNPRPLKGYPFKKKMEKKIKGILFSRYIDVFVGVSEYTKQALLNDFGYHINNKVIVVLNGLNVKKFIQKTDFTSNNKFIVASHLRKDKGIQDLILAVRNLEAFDFTIDIYGKGYYGRELEEMTQENSLQGKIRFKGSVSNLHEIYCKYDYLIHPSHGETFCYSVVESLLSHLPVITTKRQGNVLGLVVNKINGFLFKEVDVMELEKIMHAILIGGYKIGSFSSNGISQIFSLEKMVENHLELIQGNKK